MLANDDCGDIVGPPDMRPGLCVLVSVCGCAGLAAVLERKAVGMTRRVGRDEGLAKYRQLVSNMYRRESLSGFTAKS